MPTDLELLVVSLDADVNKLQKQLAKAGVLLDGFDKDADAKTKRTRDKINKNLGEVANDNAGLNHNQFQILSHAARASFESLAAGANPLRVLAQESVKASAAIGPEGLAGTLALLKSPLGIIGTGFAAAAAGAAYLGFSWSEAQEKIKLGLTGIGAASGATVNDINRIAEAAAQSGKITVGSARDIATALASTGKIGVDNIPGIVGLAPGYAKAFGTDIGTAGEQLAKIFSDPSKGADELNARLGILDGRTREYILTLSAQGDRQKAISELARLAQPELEKAAELTSLWARAWQAVSSGASSAANAVGSAFDDGPSKRLAAAQRNLDAAKAALDAPARQPSAFESLGLGVGSGDRAAESRKKAYEDALETVQKLQKAVDDLDDAEQDNALEKQANDLSLQATAIVHAYDEAGQAIRATENQIVELQHVLENADATEKTDGGFAKIKETVDALSGRLELLKKDYAEGGAAAAAALRQAQFQQQIAGLSSYERGLREITFRFQEMRRAAIEAGNAKALPSINDQEKAALGAYATQTKLAAQQQVPISSTFVQSLIGAESSGDPNAVSKTGATGLGQFTKGTWIDQFRKHLSDVAAQIDQANNGDQAAANKAILALRTNREYQLKLIQTLAQENGEALAQKGFAGTDRNLYLAHVAGAGGANALLEAERAGQGGQNAQAILDKIDPKITSLNASYFGNGKSVDQALATVQKAIALGGQAAKTQQQNIVNTNAETQAYDQSAAAQARLSSIQQQLNADREAGGDLGKQFANAQDLIKASSDKLTPALATQRDQILATADALAKATAAGQDTRFNTDLSNARGALGRTSDEQATYAQAKQYAAPGTPEFDRYTKSLQDLRDAASAKDTAGGFLKGLTSDLINGTKFSVALTNQLKRLASSLADKAIDKLLSGFLGLGGGGGLFGSIFGGGSAGAASGAGFANHLVTAATGGLISGPGGSTTDSIMARLSNGEFVVNAAQTAKFRPLLERINTGRYANGGFVGTPRIGTAVPPAGSSGQLAMNVVVDVRGATGNAEVRSMVEAGMNRAYAAALRDAPGYLRAKQVRGTR